MGVGGRDNQAVSFGERLLELRKSMGVTQEFVGEKLGVSAQAVSKWEKGDSSPDISMLKALASLYRISIDTLLNVPYQPEIESIERRVEEMLLSTRVADEVRSVPKDIGDLVWRVWKAAFFCEMPNEGDRNREKRRGNYRLVSKDNLMVWDDAGIAAIVKEDLYDRFGDLKGSDVQKLASLLDDKYLQVIAILKPQTFLTREDIVAGTSLCDEEVAEILLDLLNKELIRVRKRRYYLSPAKGIAVAMLLASLYLLQRGKYSLSEYGMPLTDTYAQR